MLKKEVNNIINLSRVMLANEDNDIETVPYSNNNGDEMQDILSEIESNTKDLKKGLTFRKKNKNVIKVNFSRSHSE